MKYYELLACCEFLQSFKHINSILRVEDNTLKINFQNFTLYANMKRGASALFTCSRFYAARRYCAPFDTALAKRFTNAAIERMNVSLNDRVLNIKVLQKNSYKTTVSTLRLEFTGRNTNAIILDENEIVAEALRHIDESVSCRAVKIGEKLAVLPHFTIHESAVKIDDAEVFLHECYSAMQKKELESFKAVKTALLSKKIDKLQKMLDDLGSENELQKEAFLESKKAELLLMHRHVLKDYEKECELADIDGQSYKIALDGRVQESIDKLFDKAKKLKQKAKSLHKERQNLTEKIEFAKLLLGALSEAENKEEAEILLPKRKAADKKEEAKSAFCAFFIEGCKALVGKNEKGNAEILKTAKKNDIWFHVKDIASAHVILKTDKSGVPANALEFCAKLCVNFSTLGAGVYEVDFTPRRNVKIISGAHVTYTDFKTVCISKS
ncbi:MAG: NFACT RNA binding domain-containing protein [Campylobacteraceae bacterium]|jgi:predicted ribosome quality control (RQC) complex YloA/Tae2 family protein|nr:NFACT RNA binding domain-containing protein [Campylobacteraceae bacterium]